MVTATIDELFPIVKETKTITPKQLGGKTIKIRALTKGDFRRMKEFTDEHKNDPTLVDAWVFKTVMVEPDLSSFSVEEIRKKMDEGYLINTIEITKDILDFSKVSDKEIEEIKKLAAIPTQ